MISTNGLRDEKQVQIEFDGKTYTYTISKVPAMAGLEIFTQFLPSSLPKLGDFLLYKSLIVKLLSYSGVTHENGAFLRLTSEALIDSHVLEWEMVYLLAYQMAEYNCSFFRNGRASTFFQGFAQTMIQWATKMSTELLEQLLQKIRPPSMNSEQSIP